MDTYAEIKKLNARVTQGEIDLLKLREEMRRIGGDRLSDLQLAAAIKPVEARVDQVEVDVAAALAGTEPVILNADSPSDEDNISTLMRNEAVVNAELGVSGAAMAAFAAGLPVELAVPVLEGDEAPRAPLSRAPIPGLAEWVAAESADAPAAESHTPEPQPAPNPPVKRRPGRPRKG